MSEYFLVAGKYETLPVLLSIVQDASHSLESFEKVCELLKILLVESRLMKVKFLELKGPETFLQFSQKQDRLSLVLEVIIAACKKDEPLKCK